jgi:superfamily II DNA or RNA helicase
MPSFRILSPERGYRNDYLWLPKQAISNLRGIKNMLTFPQDQEAPIYAWDETADHLVVPREFIPYSEYGTLPYQITDLTEDKFPQLPPIQLTHDLRDAAQRIGYKSLLEGGSGVLSLACGKGKTVVALHGWAAVQRPALVVVDTKDILYQWRDRILEHTNTDEEDVGLVGDGHWNWEHPITVASIRTLARRATEFELPDEMEDHFGLAIYDEVHILGAPFFNTTAALCSGMRWGLSATHERDDGLDALYKYHIGDVLYENLEQDMIPDCFFVFTGVHIPVTELEKLKVKGELNFSHLCTWLSKHEGRNDQICGYIDRCLSEGRRLLVLSHKPEHLIRLHSRYDDAGLIHGGVKGKHRASQLYDHNAVFATTSLAQKALDRKDLDTVMIVLPFKKKGMFQQIIGRIQRELMGKNEPMVIIFEDEKVRIVHNQCKTLRTHLTNFKYPFFIKRGADVHKKHRRRQDNPTR